ncbi:MAG: Cytochrome c-type biogenesis protein CcmF [Alphaproteobacteria bacterium MarineAlpha5_Bin8]|nr:MAG: Cytochrome c-type biogenesis protein CcmF [Alphaproteobacteria bacterium MarineAlpha5_Bin7]PPR46367.1 MAG: Cytochrome c-type biogenesis protein CcmF [Alphaproteobacteria bacterium MarineAlpha5_Bin8]PPR54916.1 MAG: Cytochrome c-type biogenesis protein CcmF [Alphaproteobacteria bacterium MarineAlpha5_Bin6]|tara:strand:+ start:856 stop:2721 length:1866 start_codon:yes stop_codon:yes gene_type:complete
MLSQIGFVFLLLSFISGLGIVFFYNLKKNKLFYYLVYLSFLSIVISFLSLMASYIISDFSNYNVFQNSHSSMPLLYKITGTWGNHEGSMLLWLLIMNLYNFLFSFNKILQEKLKKLTILFQTLLFLLFCAYVIFTSNPFLMNSINVEEGLGLNPILQDFSLSIHPPILYSGYVGFSIILSLALSGLFAGQLDNKWIKTLRKWSLFCWSMLTAGIVLGSYWAYYELGWGGWWFWDPVENISLMPWIAGLALVHSLIINNKAIILKNWIIFLSILCFALSILGTFLVRSGILTSVHTFAADYTRGIFILIIFLVIVGFSFLIFIIKSSENKEKINILFINKTTAIIINNLVMIIACSTILLGTLYPIIIEVLINQRISVGAPYYNSTVLPILLPGFLLMSVAPALSWTTNKLNNGKFYLYFFILISFVVLIFSFISESSVWGFVGILLAVWIIISSLFSIFINLLKNIKNLKFNFILKNNAFIAHLGVGIAILGITCSTVFKTEYKKNMNVEESFYFKSYELKFESLNIVEENNFQSIIGSFILYKKDKFLSKIEPEKRYYDVSKIITTEAGIYHHPFQDFYMILGDNNNERWSIILYQNPLVSLIWLGTFIMIISGFIGLKK